MSDRAPYSRVYWSIPDDEKFVTIFDNDANLAAWLRMLLIADQAYPASGAVPTNCKRSAVKALVEAGLIDLSGSRFWVKGLKSERERRSKVPPKSDPNGTQKGPKPDPSGYTDKDEDKTRQDEDETSQGQAEGVRDPADIYWSMTGRFPTDKALAWIDSLTEQYGGESVIAAMAGAFLEDRSPQTVLGRTRDRLAAHVRKLDLKERAAEKQRIAENRAAVPSHEPDLTEDQIRELADAYRESHAA